MSASDFDPAGEAMSAGEEERLNQMAEEHSGGPDVIDLKAWKGKLQTGNRGVKKSITNLMLHLQNIPALGANIKWNELAHIAEWNGKPLEEGDLIDIRVILENEGFEPPVGDVLNAVQRHAKDNAYHPVREYLTRLKWDGVERLDYWLHQCLGAQDAPFNRLAGRKTLIAAVARAFEPGCKVDTVLVLEGEQGIKKSSAIAALFSRGWTAESVNLFDQHNKMVMAMMGAWVVELAEFIAVAKRNENTVKGLLSMQSDRIVLPYAKIASDHPRQCIFFGTINPGESGYLTDATGNRRYWPVPVVKADIELIEKRREQIWAEAVSAYQSGERWWLEGDEEIAIARDAVETRERGDIWDEILAERLEREGIKSITASRALNLIGVLNDRMDEKARERVSGCLRRLGFASVPRKERGPDGKLRAVRIYRKEP